jgi:hypothetical protein
MQRCPHCEELSITNFQKLITGPAITGKCKNCNKRFTVSYSSLVSALVYLVVFIIFAFLTEKVFDGVFVYYLYTAITWPIWSYWYLKNIPLIKAKK